MMALISSSENQRPIKALQPPAVTMQKGKTENDRSDFKCSSESV